MRLRPGHAGPGRRRVVRADSIIMLLPEDVGQIVVTGSHAALFRGGAVIVSQIGRTAAHDSQINLARGPKVETWNVLLNPLKSLCAQ